MNSYESKIIHTLIGPFPTIHDYTRLDLSHITNKFKYHVYWIFDGSFCSYQRYGGTYKIRKIDGVKYTHCIELTMTTLYTLKEDTEEDTDTNTEEDTDENVTMETFLSYCDTLKDLENIYESEEQLNLSASTFCKLKKTDLKNTPFVSKTVFFSGKFYSRDENRLCLEILTDRKPFGRCVSNIYRKILLRPIISV